jgi:hypothetical protein
MAYYEGAVLEVEHIGKRKGTRYRVTLAMIDGEEKEALVYLDGKETIDEYGHAAYETYFMCWFHRSVACQCVEAVKDERKRCFQDPTENKDGA